MTSKADVISLPAWSMTVALIACATFSIELDSRLIHMSSSRHDLDDGSALTLWFSGQDVLCTVLRMQLRQSMYTEKGKEDAPSSQWEQKINALSYHRNYFGSLEARQVILPRFYVCDSRVWGMHSAPHETSPIKPDRLLQNRGEAVNSVCAQIIELGSLHQVAWALYAQT